MSSSPVVIEFGSMAYFRWNNHLVCCHAACPAKKGKPHVWVKEITKDDNELPTACGKCKRITWNREDRRFTKLEPGTKRKPKRKGRNK